jgi:hypothetical protein
VVSLCSLLKLLMEQISWRHDAQKFRPSLDMVSFTHPSRNAMWPRLSTPYTPPNPYYL